MPSTSATQISEMLYRNDRNSAVRRTICPEAAEIDIILLDSDAFHSSNLTEC